MLLSNAPGVVVVRGTWLHSDFYDSKICPQEYSVLRCDHEFVGGGAAILHRRCLSCVRIVESSLNICAHYRPPSLFLELVNKLNDLFVVTLAALSWQVDLPDIIWETLSFGNRDRLHAETLLDLAYARDRVQFVCGATRELSICTRLSVLEL